MRDPEPLPDDHQDAAVLNTILQAVLACLPEVDWLGRLAERMDAALEIALDPVRTARTRIVDLDRVEKTFVGLLVEQQIRDLLNVPKGQRRDLSVGGTEVDVKCTVSHRQGWMIPTETYREEGVCLVVKIDDIERLFDVGLFVARSSYLGSEDGNRDKKRGILAEGVKNILWIARSAPLPRSKWDGIDMTRFRVLRREGAGSKRAAAFLRENLEMAIHRTVLLSLLPDQLDPIKRVRGNSGARDILRKEQIAVLSARSDNQRLRLLGMPLLGKLEFMAIRLNTDERRLAFSFNGVDAT